MCWKYKCSLSLANVHSPKSESSSPIDAPISLITLDNWHCFWNLALMLWAPCKKNSNETYIISHSRYMLSDTIHDKDSASTCFAFILCHNAVCGTCCSYNANGVNHTVSSTLRTIHAHVHVTLLSLWFLQCLSKSGQLQFRLPFTAPLPYTHLHITWLQLPEKSMARLWPDTWAANHCLTPMCLLRRHFRLAVYPATKAWDYNRWFWFQYRFLTTVLYSTVKWTVNTRKCINNEVRSHYCFNSLVWLNTKHVTKNVISWRKASSCGRK